MVEEMVTSNAPKLILRVDYQLVYELKKKKKNSTRLNLIDKFNNRKRKNAARKLI